MATIINIETSTSVCSATLAKDGEILLNKENHEGQNHSVVLGPFVKELSEAAASRGLKVDAVAVSCGPGSYTGLRIGVSTAKGLCYGYGAQLISVNTLRLMSNHVISSQKVEDDAWLCPMIDARRMEVYTAFYNTKLEETVATKADIIKADSYTDIYKAHKVYCFGNGANKCKETLKNSNLVYLDGVDPLAKDMVELSEAAFAQHKFEDVAYFEPFYLKEFVALHPQNKLF
jgi:tRNA threonylcarbamoyladenosine biosynthesis protein TsaB